MSGRESCEKKFIERLTHYLFSAIGSEEDSDLNSGSNSDSGPSSGSGSVSEAAASFRVTWFQTIAAVLLVAFGCFW